MWWVCVWFFFNKNKQTPPPSHLPNNHKRLSCSIFSQKNKNRTGTTRFLILQQDVTGQYGQKSNEVSCSTCFATLVTRLGEKTCTSGRELLLSFLLGQKGNVKPCDNSASDSREAQCVDVAKKPAYAFLQALLS